MFLFVLEFIGTSMSLTLILLFRFLARESNTRTYDYVDCVFEFSKRWVHMGIIGITQTCQTKLTTVVSFWSEPCEEPPVITSSSTSGFKRIWIIHLWVGWSLGGGWNVSDQCSPVSWWLPMTDPNGAGILMLTWLGVYWWDPWHTIYRSTARIRHGWYIYIYIYIWH